jgi:2,5-diketo-D-gluconate reductase B
MMKLLDVQGQSMPALGFGTWKLRDAECVRSVDFALNNGYRHVDTAQVYENEAEVGEGIKKSGVARSDIFLTTKVWRDNFSEKRVIESVEESLKKLQTDYVDLLLVHWPFPEVSIVELVEGVMAAQEQGKAKLIGVSNFTTAQMEEARIISGGKVCNNQVEYHPYLNQTPVYDYTQKNGMVMTAYSPIARGKVLDDAVLKEIGLKHGKSAGQVTLRWFMQQDNVAAIPKSATPENIKSNINIFDFELSDEEMNKISALAKPDGRQVNPDFAPKWDAAA